jgi:predicted Fe-S protein YdhL (DUF1289 family)
VASSPCIQICVIDPASGLCEGCGRTLAEIADWSRLSEAERLAIMARLPQRMRSRDAGELSAPPVPSAPRR